MAPSWIRLLVRLNLLFKHPVCRLSNSSQVASTRIPVHVMGTFWGLIFGVQSVGKGSKHDLLCTVTKILKLSRVVPHFR
jgi:hypothetical protein